MIANNLALLDVVIAEHQANVRRQMQRAAIETGSRPAYGFLRAIVRILGADRTEPPAPAAIPVPAEPRPQPHPLPTHPRFLPSAPGDALDRAA